MLEVYTLDQSDEWDNIVRLFEEHDVYWLSGYVKAFNFHGDGEPLLFYYRDGITRGINVVMRRDVSQDKRFYNMLPENKYYDFATPYGYGGWIIEGSDTKRVFDAYYEWLIKNEIVCEFVRFHPMIKNHELSRNFYEVIPLGEVVHMELTKPEDIWNNIISKNRNVIRKAKKNGVKIYNGRFPEIYDNFRILYNATMDKDNAEDYYYFEKEFYESILQDLPQNAQVFWAEKDNKIIAASIMLATNRRMNYHLSGSLREYSSLAPTNLLLYEAALWGCANGYKTLYLGGGVRSGEDSLFKFKRAFYRGELNHFFIGKRVFDKDKYEELISFRQNIVNQGYFPMYRG